MTEASITDNVLLRFYERYIGEPERETDVYLGFGLFFAGVAAAALGLVLVLIGATLHDFGTDPFYDITRPGGVLLLLSLPVTLTAIVVLLPVRQRVTIAAGIGVAITVIASILFWIEYPGVIFGSNQNMSVVLGYALGITVVTGATAAALIAHHLQRAQAPHPSEITEMEVEEDESYTDEEIRADIEEAMTGVDLSWGGVMKEEHRRLEFESDYADDVSGNMNIGAPKTVAEGGVDDQVQQLKALKGGTHKRSTSPTTVDEQTDALRALKRQKEQDEVPENAPVHSGGFLGRFLNRLGLR